MKLRSITKMYDDLNRTCFAGRLLRPTILMSRMSDNHGKYVYGGNTERTVMHFNPSDERGLRETRATVFHEMVHQYLNEFLGIDEELDHGKVFWDTYFQCADLTFDWESTYD